MKILFKRRAWPFILWSLFAISSASSKAHELRNDTAQNAAFPQNEEAAEFASKLAEAIFSKDAKTVKSLLNPVKRFPTFFAFDSILRTPLQLAASLGAVEVLDVFFELSARSPHFMAHIFRPSPEGITALHLAVANGEIASVERLIMFAKQDFSIALYLSQTTSDGSNALHSAVKFGRSEIVRLLLQSPLKTLLAENLPLFANAREWQPTDAALWKILLEHMPELAYHNFDLPGVGHLGQLEAAFYFGDVERTEALEQMHFLWDQDLFLAMLSNKEDFKEEEYYEFMYKLNPLAYYLAYYGALVGSTVSNFFTKSKEK